MSEQFSDRLWSPVVTGGVLTGIMTNFPIRMGAQYGMNGTIFFQFNFKRIAEAWIIGVVVPSIFTIIPSAKSAFIEPVEALRR
jgi:putative ABC transport system permease protein